ncbi:MAG: transcription antitermination factor NusB [Synergistaceae bacterium]|jgi:N utilization substance protein B|nr:transcription antitermination factor NusB [Synergistaceae bacterium]
MKKSYSVQSRHRARELAAQFLYLLASRPGLDPDVCLETLLAEDGFAPGERGEVREYLSFLVKGGWKRRTEIDNWMRMVVTGWRPENMAAVDRAVLRVAIFEGFLEKTVPVAVAISEAVELAQIFGTEASGKFVNGVLGRLARQKSLDGDKGGGDGGASSASENAADR